MDKPHDQSERMSYVASCRWAKMGWHEKGLAMKALTAARNAKLTPERRSEIARHAAVERWNWVRQLRARKQA